MYEIGGESIELNYETNSSKIHNGYVKSNNILFTGKLIEQKDGKDFFDPKLNINVGLQYFVTSRISARAELTYFQLHGKDETSGDQSRVSRNLSFTSNNFELNATGAISLFPLAQRFYQRPVFNAYVFAGVGLLYTNPKATLDGLLKNKAELTKVLTYHVVAGKEVTKPARGGSVL